MKSTKNDNVKGTKNSSFPTAQDDSSLNTLINLQRRLTKNQVFVLMKKYHS